jgi:hypothetical protein
MEMVNKSIALQLSTRRIYLSRMPVLVNKLKLSLLADVAISLCEGFCGYSAMKYIFTCFEEYVHGKLAS